MRPEDELSSQGSSRAEAPGTERAAVFMRPRPPVLERSDRDKSDEVREARENLRLGPSQWRDLSFYSEPNTKDQRVSTEEYNLTLVFS